MPKVYFGTKNEPAFDLEQSDDLIAVRTRSGRSIARAAGPVPTALQAELEDGTLVAAYPEAGVEVYRVPIDRGRSIDDRKAALRASSDVRFAGRVLVDPATREPVLYTENLFIKFTDRTDPDDCVAIIREAGLKVKNEVAYATNAYFVEAPESTGQKVFQIAVQLLKRKDVEYCHPELIRLRARKEIFSQQWHLMKTVVEEVMIDAHANVESAHQITHGQGVTIAIIDDGVDIDHPEFRSAGKIVAPSNIFPLTNDPRPRNGERHGTACAGVACANGTTGASGVAPDARLMPIRLSPGLGSQYEAEAFFWAAEHGADVISCSWGPDDGYWWIPDDPYHDRVVQLPASMKLAIDYVVANGRDGKGCVVLFAAGNGRESVENDGYASYEKVIAVAACNDRGKRSVYSDFGSAIWCAFPSSDDGWEEINHPDPLTPGIWTTDRLGEEGYNAHGDFTFGFGGTSSACPGAAGVAALVLSVNPNLKWHEVRDVLRRACEKIDPQGGQYNPSGHSNLYGYGRLNARTAVELAQPQPQSGITISRRFDAPIPDLQEVSFALRVPDNTPVENLTVGIDLKHTYISDLIITLKPPASTRVNPVVLHDRAGGAARNLKKTYDSDTTPALARFAGKSCRGTWRLVIQDAAEQDSGELVSFSLGLTFAHPTSGPRTPKRRPTTRKKRKRR